MSLSSFSFTDRWRPICRVGVGDTRTPVGVAVWGSSTWGNAGSTWNGGEPVWQDVSCYCQSADWDAGRDWSIDRFPPAMATIRALNPDGWATSEADPSRTLRPGRQVMIGVVDTATGLEQTLFRGFVDNVQPTFDPTDGDGVTIVAVDGVGELGLYQLSAPYGSPQGANESGDNRFRRILSLAGWPTRWTGTVDPSSVRMAGSLFEQAFSEELGITADSEGGAVVCNLAGQVCYRSRDWLTWPADAGTVWDIGNAGVAGEVCPSAFELSDDRADIANMVRFGNSAGASVVAQSTSSQSLYGVIPAVRDDLICNDPGQLGVLARRTVAIRAPGGDRVRAVTLEAVSDPDAIVPMMLAADVSASPPIRAHLRLLEDGATRFDQLGVLQRVSHRVERDSWSVRFGFDLAAPYVRPVARWGSGPWDESLWARITTSELEDVVRGLVREVMA